MADVLSLPFMQRALAGGILVAFLASYYGVFIVQRGLSFLGSGLAHAAFGGIALGLLLNSEPLWIAIPFTVIVAIGIVWVRNNSQLANDTVIGIFFAVSMALGIIFLSLRMEYSSEAFTYLFGSILSVNKSDIAAAGSIAFITLFTGGLWKRWAYASFDEELAQTDRLPVVRDNYVLVILIAITVVAAIKIVGIVLIAAFLVIPAATARLISPTFFRMTIVSVVMGIGSVILGLFGSFHLDVPSGAAIILFQAIIFFVILVISIVTKQNQ